eukprot:3657727-Rhodomonas_salina.3
MYLFDPGYPVPPGTSVPDLGTPGTRVPGYPGTRVPGVLNTRKTPPQVFQVENVIHQQCEEMKATLFKQSL